MNFFKAVITLLASFFPSVHAAHVLFKDQSVCSSDDENIKDIYDNILCFHPLSSTEEINEAISKKYPEYSVHFISDTLYGFHNILMNCIKKKESVDWGQEEWKNFDLKKYFSDWPCDKAVNYLINSYYSGEGPSSADFWPKINQSFLHEFGLMQDYFTKNNAFKQKAPEVWEIYKTLTKKRPILDVNNLYYLDKTIFQKVCELEEASDQKIVLIRGTDGIGGKIDSTNHGKYGKSLSFGAGLFQAANSWDIGGGPLRYVKLSYFYAVPIDKKNTSNIFLPKVTPLVSMNSGGEWHPRTFLYGTHGEEIFARDCYGMGLSLGPQGVKLSPDFCCDASSLAQEKFHNHVEWTVLIRAVPLKDERKFFDTAFTQLKNLYEGDLETKEERKKDFIKFLKKYEQTYSEEVRSSDSEEDRLPEVKKEEVCSSDSEEDRLPEVKKEEVCSSDSEEGRLPEVKKYRMCLETGLTEAELSQRKQDLEQNKQDIFRSYNNLIKEENGYSAGSCVKIKENSMILAMKYSDLLRTTEIVIENFQTILPEDLNISGLVEIKNFCKQKVDDLNAIQEPKEDDSGHKKLKKGSEEK